MKTHDWVTFLIVVIVLLFLPPIVSSSRFGTLTAGIVRRDDALEACKLIKDWGVWLTGIQIGAITALSWILKDKPGSNPFAMAAVVFFVASIAMDTYLLAGLPSIVLHLSHTDSTLNDIYQTKLFTEPRNYHLRLGTAYVVSHWYFIFGIVCFCIIFLTRNMKYS